VSSAPALIKIISGIQFSKTQLVFLPLSVTKDRLPISPTDNPEIIEFPELIKSK